MPREGVAPFVSIVVPARNAGATLRETLDCLLAQTHADWEAIVVDDDSTDDTVAIAEGYAARDARFYVVRTVAHSEGGSRNIGITHARGAWLLFLDADDLIEARTVERFAGALAAVPTADGTVASWVRFDERRTSDPQHWDDREVRFERVASHTPFPIHACIVRRSIVADVGMFDGSLYGVADWDLWQRVFRSGAAVFRIGDTLAKYRSHGAAMSRDARAMFLQSLVVIDRGYAPDPRVRNPLPAYAAGAPRHARGSTIVRHLCWWSGGALATGQDALVLLEDAADALGGHRPQDVSAELVAAALEEAIRLPTLASPAEWGSVWPEVRQKARAFLAGIESLLGVPGLAWRAELLLRLPDEATAASAPPGMSALDVELTEPIRAPEVEHGARRIVCVARIEGRALGLVEQDVVDGTLDTPAIVDELCERFFWDLAREHLERRALVRRGADSHEMWAALLSELWPPATRRWSPIRVAAGRPIEIDVGELPHILTATRGVDVVMRVGSRPLGAVRVAAPDALRRSRLARSIAIAYGAELFRAVAREAWIGRKPTNEPLHRSLRRASPGGRIPLAPDAQ